MLAADTQHLALEPGVDRKKYYMDVINFEGDFTNRIKMLWCIFSQGKVESYIINWSIY